MHSIGVFVTFARRNVCMIATEGGGHFLPSLFLMDAHTQKTVMLGWDCGPAYIHIATYR